MFKLSLVPPSASGISYRSYPPGKHVHPYPPTNQSPLQGAYNLTQNRKIKQLESPADVSLMSFSLSPLPAFALSLALIELGDSLVWPGSPGIPVLPCSSSQCFRKELFSLSHHPICVKPKPSILEADPFFAVQLQQCNSPDHHRDLGLHNKETKVYGLTGDL